MYLFKPSEFINQFDGDIAEFRGKASFIANRIFRSIVSRSLSITRVPLSVFKGTVPACARNKEESLLWNNKFQVTGSERLLGFSYAVTIFLRGRDSNFA